MTPNKPFRRTELLRIVADRLQQADDREYPLVRTVRDIMDSVPPIDPAREANGDQPGRLPIPLGEVAAYVDGTLEDPLTEERITAQAAHDEDVMIEIVMAMRAQVEGHDRSLPPPLRARLLGMGSALAVRTEADPLDGVLPPIRSSVESANESPTVSPEIVTVATAPEKHPAADGKSWKPIAIASISIAAALLIMVGWLLTQDKRTREQPPIAREPIPELSPAPEPARDVGEPMLADDPHSESSEPSTSEALRPIPLPERVNDVQVVEAPPISPDDSMVVEGPKPSPKVVPEPEPPEPIRNRRLVATVRRVDGLLLQSETPEVIDGSLASETKRSLKEGSAVELVNVEDQEPLRLETLPLCRAEAELSGGGQLVISEDTRVETTPRGSIDVRFGSIALMDLNKGSEIRLEINRGRNVPVRGTETSSVVVRRVTGGMEFDVADEPVEIAGQPFKNAIVRVNPVTLRPMVVAEGPERLPKWTRERVDRIEIGRNVLAQLSMSDDVGLSIQQSLRAPGLRGEAGLILRRWLVASRRDQLFRLVSSDDPILREAALMYLRETRPQDPRHFELWRRIRVSAQNQRNVAIIRSVLGDYWAGKRPIPARRDALLALLQAPDPGVRATGDFMLRSFYGKGPPFIMDANARLQQRMVNSWRTIISRVDR